MKKKSIGVNASLNVLKQIFMILFPMVTVYYATRVLGKTNYGSVNYIKSITSYFTLFAGLGVSTYAVREGSYFRDSKIKYSQFASEVFTINVIATLISYVTLILFAFTFNDNNVNGWFELLFIFSFSMVLTTIGADWVNTTYEDFLYITVRYLIFYILSFIALFLFVKDSSDFTTYAIILVFSSVGGNILNVFYIQRYVHLKLVPLKNTIKHIKRILILFSSNIAATIYINSDTTMIGALVGTKEVAIYTVSSNIYIAVKQISNAAITVVMPRMISLINDNKIDDYKKLVNKMISYVFAVIAPASIGVFFLSSRLMIFMGGNDYFEGGKSLSILSIALVIATINFIISRCVTLPYKEDKIYLYTTAVSAFINITMNFGFIPLFSYNGAAITTLVAEILVFLFLYINSRKYLVIDFFNNDSIKVIIGCILVALNCSLITNYVEVENIAIILFSTISSVIIYSINLIILRHSIAREIKKYLKRKINYNIKF
ncbi:flippase [Streptococcus uberis]|uniref:flippase n=1 Tax=Streptococcus uberis TaxID=1349 RepID=UPI0012B5AF45|nr:flippase [Streptococcus uberis]MTB70077.1 oligosaccharide flippase family protein [Streptococcus uberis]